MIPRYSLPEMAAVWTDARRLAAWKEVEALVVEAWAQLGVAPAEAAVHINAAPVPTPEQVAEREKVTDHDMAAFVDVLAASVPKGGEWIHYGLTSSDVLDTAGGVIMSEAADLLIDATAVLFETVRRLALEHRHSAMVGRTHGIWAEPTSFGLKLAGWAMEVARDHQRLQQARERVAVGKISGAVGTYAHAPQEIESYVCARLGLAVEPASTQVVPRDRHAEFLATIALTGASLERFATEIRHLQRSEVGEVAEPFRMGQKGSSAMPHKRNPIVAERITGLARLLRGYAQVSLENVALWHERDISHSAAERVILPDACLVLYYMLVRFRALLEGMVVNTGRMRENLEATRGLVFSQAVLLALVGKGSTRDGAYRIVQESAMKTWEEGLHLRDVLAADPRVELSAPELDTCFQSDRFLNNAEVVYERLQSVELGGESRR
ncbi:MAG: adenylosuccinate lyase [Acidimicrobiia bacterium]|nr:adenylosuccinate lyase [Acidimicrobiia bacterium]